MSKLQFTLSEVLVVAIVAGTAWGAQTQPLQNCSQGRVIYAQDATLTRPKVSTGPGVLFSDSGHFQAHGADEPCDAGKSLGPFEVDAPGELVLRITGGPAIRHVWSLSNSGTGIGIYIEPKLGNGYGPRQEIVATALAVDETETEIGGSWGGPGRITALVGAPRGTGPLTGPLTGSCFEQSYTATAEIITVQASQPLMPGYVIEPGDRIATGPNGRVVINQMLLSVDPMSDVFFDNQSTGVRGETFDPVTGRLPDDGFEWLRNLGKRMSDLRDDGYPQPDRPDFNGYRTDTLEVLAGKLGDLTDPCKAAVLAKLYLDAHQHEFTEMTALAIGLEILAIDKIPNNWKIAAILLRKAAMLSVPGLSQAAVAEDTLSVADLIRRYSAGSGAGWRGRWGLKIYETAVTGKWNSARIAEERRARQGEIEALNAKIHTLTEAMRQEGLRLQQEYLDWETRIKSTLRQRLLEIDADKKVDGETARRQAWLNDPENKDYARPGIWYRPGEEIADREPLSEARQRYLSEAVYHYARARDSAKLAAAAEGAAALVAYEIKLRAMGWQFNRDIAAKLSRIAELQTESNVLKDYAEPVNTDNCEKLRSLAPPEPICRKQVTLLSGLLHIDRPDLPRDIENLLPSGRPDPNPRSPVLGHSLISIVVNKLLAWPKGTRFSVRADGGDATIHVFEGEVFVQGEDGRIQVLQPGQQMNAADREVSRPSAEAEPAAYLHGLPLGETLTVGDQPQGHGSYPLSLRDGVPSHGWRWRDPGGDATLTAGEGQASVIATVPDGNEIWAGRADGPRLLHMVTGDFDLDLGLNMVTAEGANHLAITEFALHAPGAQLGYLAGQASNPTAPGADLRLLGGAWTRYQGTSSLPALNQDKGVTPPDDATVEFRLSRRGDLFFTQWSLDGEHWTLGTREEISAPRTLWAGLAFKRIAHDGQHGSPAVSTLRHMVLTSRPVGAFVDPPMLAIQAAGSVTPLLDGWYMQHDAETSGALSITTPKPIEGDFDAVLKVDFGKPVVGSESVAAGLILIGADKGDWAYVALSAGSPHGGRYQTHQSRDGSANRYAWENT